VRSSCKKQGYLEGAKEHEGKVSKSLKPSSLKDSDRAVFYFPFGEGSGLRRNSLAREKGGTPEESLKGRV